MTRTQTPADRLPRRWIGGGFVLVLTCVGQSANAQTVPMTVSEFLAKETTARAAGAGAGESAEVKAMRAELARAVAAYRADLAAQRADGSPLHSCPPPKGRAGLTSTDVLKYFRALPASDRMVSVRDGLYAMMRARYPCRPPN